MKKILLGIGLIACGIGAQAQELYRPLAVGPRIGANMANILDERESVTKPVFGANAGIVANLKFTKKHGMQTELVYSGKGFERKNYVKNSLHYLEIPFLYQRTFYANKKGGHLAEKRRSGNLYFILGPQISILLSSTVKFQSPIFIPEGDPGTLDVYSYTRPFDLSAVGGVGYSFKNGFAIDARYALGLRHLHGEPHRYIPQDVSNTAIQVGASYLLPLKFK